MIESNNKFLGRPREQGTKIENISKFILQKLANLPPMASKKICKQNRRRLKKYVRKKKQNFQRELIFSLSQTYTRTGCNNCVPG